MTARRSVHASKAFTLIEVMIVVTIVAILSLLAMVAVGRIKERAARTVILNNLRQLFEAKEFYFSGTPDDPKSGSIITLANKGFISPAVKDRLMSPRSYEAALGWHYFVIIKPGESVFAYKGVVSGGKPTGEAIYYPNAEDAAPAQAPVPAATATQAPNPAPTPQAPAVPAGMIGGNHPLAPVAKPDVQLPASPAMQGYIRFSSVLQATGAQSPDGSSFEIVGLAGDPGVIQPVAIGGSGDAKAFLLRWTAPSSNARKEYQFTLTLRNAHGETQVPVTIRH